MILSMFTFTAMTGKCRIILLIFYFSIPPILSESFTEVEQQDKNSIIGITESPQQMWDPERGSILGKDLATFRNAEYLSQTNQTVQVGSSTFLDCQVRNLADKKVSWIRRRDNHILTSGILTYTNDERFSVVRPEGSDNWALLVRYVQQRDEGTYECQVSTKTGRYGYSVNLLVVIPKASIEGSHELHVQSGSTISLFCIIKDVLRPPHFVLWYHNKKIINHSQVKNRVIIHTELGHNPTSKLTITGAAFDDSGNYTCVATDSEPASVNVFVSEGDKTAAIQRLGSGSHRIGQSHVAQLLLSISSIFFSVIFYKSVKFFDFSNKMNAKITT